MKLEKGSISSKDLMFSVFCFMQGTVLRSGFIISVTRQDSWAMAITGFLLTLPILAVYTGLLRKFPGKNLIEIDDIVFGPVFGKILSALYLFFFVSLAALNTRDLGNFVAGYMMPETPIAAVTLVFLVGCAYALRKGIENLMHLSVLFTIIAMGALAVNSILLLKDVQPEFLKPFFQLKFPEFVQGTVSVAAVPMGEILAFTMITPMLEKGKKAGKPLLLGLALSAASMVFVIMRDIITLGPLVAIVSLPSFESMRYVSLAGILTRMESIYAVVLVILFLFKVSILLYAFVLGLTQMLSGKSPPRANPDHKGQSCETEQLQGQHSAPPLMLISVAFVFFYSLFVFESMMENMNWGATTAPFFSLTFEFLLPAVSLLVVCLRKIGKAQEVGA
ncbi:GerAB/ArcD/ProY family transporter [Caproiciproducens sp. CPB-2]|uniref:GerAB/ArcD/ProY family transporter n=1 Tax=Caproiciproducens sp. CPB-2 TaxID=3030017 RepID=UPI0023DA99A0|nr:endospore germination permease [Caproiciproducens sp. CPB-2]MDF1495246.1 endospore germination permease [Caproiciproducens sp. CPB-2]